MYKPFERVISYNTGTNIIDNVECTVVGVSADLAEFVCYIVKYDTPLPNGFDCLVLPEVCLKKLK